MEKGTCNWCLTIVQAPPNYDRRTTRLFCSTDCQMKDWLFRRWQNDEWLTYVANKRRDDNASKT